MDGVVMKLFSDKGFGFLRGTDDQEYFFHRSEVPAYNDLREAMRVSFTPSTSDKGLRAKEVSVLR